MRLPVGLGVQHHIINSQRHDVNLQFDDMTLQNQFYFLRLILRKILQPKQWSSAANCYVAQLWEYSVDIFTMRNPLTN